MVKKFQEDNFMATLVHMVAVVKKKKHNTIVNCYCYSVVVANANG